MKRLRKIVATSVVAVALAAGFVGTPLVPANPVQAATLPTATTKEACEAIGASSDCAPTDPTTGKKTDGITPVVTLIVNTLSIIVGVVAVIMIIVAGLKYITSSGDANKAKAAKDSIVHALLGLVVVALAQFMVRFVLTQAGKVN